MARERPEDGRERGREADSPRELPPAGWRDVLLRVKQSVAEDDAGLVSAGVAFYLFLALFPGIAALVTLYGLIAQPQTIQDQLSRLTVVPAEARQIVADQLEQVSSSSGGALGWTLALSLVVALWSASKGMRALIKAMNIAWKEEEKRGIVKVTALALFFTFLTVFVGVIALLVIGVVPVLLGELGLGAAAQWGAVAATWAGLVLFFTLALAMLYRWGPAREDARWRWLTPGSIAATLGWVAASLGFSFYVTRFGNFGETYGSLGAVAVMLLWLWISSFAVVLGAELNAELEHQTTRDSTTGEPRPMGERGAHVADTVGRVP